MHARTCSSVYGLGAFTCMHVSGLGLASAQNMLVSASGLGLSRLPRPRPALGAPRRPSSLLPVARCEPFHVSHMVHPCVGPV
eukprot:347417-Chlamydomonas_euryale.AAC.3